MSQRRFCCCYIPSNLQNQYLLKKSFWNFNWYCFLFVAKCLEIWFLKSCLFKALEFQHIFASTKPHRLFLVSLNILLQRKLIIAWQKVKTCGNNVQLLVSDKFFLSLSPVFFSANVQVIQSPRLHNIEVYYRQLLCEQ